MITCTISVTLQNNRRVIQGLDKIEDMLLGDHIYSIVPWTVKNDAIQATIEEADYGRYDSEGYDYLYSLLGIVPGDLIEAYLEA